MSDIRLHPDDLWKFCSRSAIRALAATPEQVAAEPLLIGEVGGRRIFNHPDGTREEWAAARAEAEALLEELGL